MMGCLYATMERVSMAVWTESYLARPSNPLKGGASQITANNSVSTTSNILVKRKDGRSRKIFMVRAIAT